jgi:hypothetical protein
MDSEIKAEIASDLELAAAWVACADTERNAWPAVQWHVNNVSANLNKVTNLLMASRGKEADTVLVNDTTQSEVIGEIKCPIWELSIPDPEGERECPTGPVNNGANLAMGYDDFSDKDRADFEDWLENGLEKDGTFLSLGRRGQPEQGGELVVNLEDLIGRDDPGRKQLREGHLTSQRALLQYVRAFYSFWREDIVSVERAKEIDLMAQFPVMKGVWRPPRQVFAELLPRVLEPDQFVTQVWPKFAGEASSGSLPRDELAYVMARVREEYILMQSPVAEYDTWKAGKKAFLDVSPDNYREKFNARRREERRRKRLAK